MMLVSFDSGGTRQRFDERHEGLEKGIRDGRVAARPFTMRFISRQKKADADQPRDKFAGMISSATATTRERMSRDQA